MEDIVDAAHKLFGARGIKGTTLAAVGEQVGLTDAGVLHHFSSKQALVQAVLDRELEQQIGQVRELIELGGLTAIRRMSVWGSVVEQTPELAGLMVVLTAEGISADSPFHEYLVRRYENVHDLVVGLIRQGIDSGEIREDVDADWEASALVAYLDGIRLQWFLSGRQIALADAVERYFDQLIDRLVREAQPPPSGRRKE
jgi:AcrR family transcriptional regulator